MYNRDMNEKFVDRFKALRLKKGATLSDIARSLGVTPQSVQQWESGRHDPRGKRVSQLAKYFGVSEAYLLYGSAEVKETSVAYPESLSSDFINIPFYDATFAAGAGSHNGDLDFVSEVMPYPKSRLDDLQVPYECAHIVKVKGDSMEPTLVDGDIILLNSNATSPTSGKIYTFDFDGDLRVKRFTKRLDGSWLITSDNPDKNIYRDEVLSSHNIGQLRIIGQVVTIVERNLL